MIACSIIITQDLALATYGWSYMNQESLTWTINDAERIIIQVILFGMIVFVGVATTNDNIIVDIVDGLDKIT